MLKTTINAKRSAQMRRDTLEGRECLVVPVVMMREGVHAGSLGPVLYTRDEMKQVTFAWNSKPVVVYHPQNTTGAATASDKATYDQTKVGVVFNTQYINNDGAAEWQAEAWLEVDRLNEVDSRILESLNNNEKIEVSTGLMLELDNTAGSFNGEDYVASAMNMQPDHLAILPDVPGACSVDDGCGLKPVGNCGCQKTNRIDPIVNELSADERYNSLRNAITESAANTESVYILDVYNDFVVYEQDNKLYRRNYTENDDSVSLEGVPVEVVRQTEYRTATNSEYVANFSIPVPGRMNMCNKELVDAIVANASIPFVEDDRDYLAALSTERLTEFVNASNSAATADPAEPVTEPEKADTEPTTDVVAEPVSNTQKPATLAEYIAAAPPEFAEVINESIANREARKAELIKAIVANDRNKFTDEHLGTMRLAELEGIAALAVDNSATETETRVDVLKTPRFTGQQGVANTSGGHTESALPAADLWGEK